MEVTCRQSGSLEEWDAFVTRHAQATAYHRSGWRRVIQQVFGRETYYLEARDNGHLAGVLPMVRLKSLMFGDFLVSMPYLNYGGMLVETPGAATALLDHCQQLARELGVQHIELRHTENRADLPVRTDKVCMHLALPGDDDALWKGLGSKLRAQVKRPLREGAEASVGGIEHVGDFYRIFSRKYRQLGVPVYPRRWFEAILREFPESTAIHTVRMGGTVVAAGLVVEHPHGDEVAWAASLRDADRVGANMFLYWSMLKHAVLRGRPAFDFGRTTEGSGTHRFKKQWGAKPVQLYWHYVLGTAADIPQLNLDNPTYRRAAAIWRRLPLWATTAIGPRLVKNLP